MPFLDHFTNAPDPSQPLAARMRPRTLSEIKGQSHILGPGRLLTRAIDADRLGSMIFYGPPGTGKTTIARVIANTTHAEFKQLNATVAGKKDMEEAVKAAALLLDRTGQRTVLFIDEIHRFNKGQQDFLLPFVEMGIVILIGATTENPYFEVNAALISRSVIFELRSLSHEDVMEILKEAAYDRERGMGSIPSEINDDVWPLLAGIADGDARTALNALELALLTTPEDPDDHKVHINADIARECIQKNAPRYDKDGDQHYDCISAFIKAMRGSDPDAALYWMARMLNAGETVTYVARRIMVHAAEDVGLADPNALNVAASAAAAAERVGMPEARIILAEAAAYVAAAPKSNAVCTGIDAAFEAVKNTGNLPVPAHLMDCHYKGAKQLGHGLGYAYPHDYPKAWVPQQYLPDALYGAKFLNMPGHGYEQNLLQYDHWRKT